VTVTFGGDDDDGDSEDEVAVKRIVVGTTTMAVTTTLFGGDNDSGAGIGQHSYPTWPANEGKGGWIGKSRRKEKEEGNKRKKG
jgi:hypothetical protein